MKKQDLAVAIVIMWITVILTLILLLGLPEMLIHWSFTAVMLYLIIEVLFLYLCHNTVDYEVLMKGTGLYWIEKYLSKYK